MSRLLEQARDAQDTVEKLESQLTALLPEDNVEQETAEAALARAQQEIETVLAAHGGNRFLHKAAHALALRLRQQWLERFEEHRWNQIS